MPILQPAVPQLPASLSFAGKTALVTGANSGLGFAASLLLLQRKVSTLIISVRNATKGESTKALLLADPLVRALKPQPTVLIRELDLSSHTSVSSFAAQLTSEFHQKLDIAILNAGVIQMAYEKSQEGNELTFQVNYLSTAILSILLLPLLAASSGSQPARLTIVGSKGALSAVLPAKFNPPATNSQTLFEHMNAPQTFGGLTTYFDSKLLIAMFVEALAQRVDASKVIVNNLDPGMVATKIFADVPWYLRPVIWAILKLRSRTPETGARVVLNAVGPAGKESHGKFLADMNLETLPFVASEKGKQMEKMLWQETFSATNGVVPGSMAAAGLTI